MTLLHDEHTTATTAAPPLIPRLEQERRRRRRRRARWRRRLGWGIGGFALAILIVGATGVWVAVMALQARDHFLALQDDLHQLESASVAGAPPARIQAWADAVHREARAVHRRTTGLLWRAWSHAPKVGTDLHVLAVGADAVTRVATGAMDPLVRVAEQAPNLRHGTTIDVAALRADAPALAQADAVVQRALALVEPLPPGNVHVVTEFRDRLQASLTRLSRQTRTLSVAGAIGPAMLGADGPRHYLVAVQNLAEARATGGIVSSYALLTTTHGRIHLDQVGSDADLRDWPGPVVNLGSELATRYGDYDVAGDWRNVTMTPDAPTAARAMLAMWARQHNGQRLDGVIAVDSTVLADILRATGPLPGPDHITLTADNVVSLTLIDYYRLYPAKAARSAAFTAATRAVFTAVQDGRGSLPTLVERLGHSAVGNHMTIVSARPNEEAALRTTEASGALPATAKPFLEVVTQDVAASKLSAYLRRSVNYVGHDTGARTDLGDGNGPQPIQAGRITVTLTSVAPTRGLPAYVVRHDPFGFLAPPDSEGVYVSVYLGRSGVLVDAKVDGKPVDVQSQTEQGMSVLSTTVQVVPGKPTVVTFDVAQPTVPGAPIIYRAQPLAVPEQLHLTSS